MFVIDPKLLRYVPKKNRKHIIGLERLSNGIELIMKWEDGFCRTPPLLDNIAEMKWAIDELEKDRDFEY